MTTRLTAWACVMCVLSARPMQAGAAKPVEKTVRAEDGVNIVLDVRGKGDTTLVFLHGWCGDRAWWKHQLAEFAKDYRVVAIDQAGHGESGKDRKEWTIAGLARDVENVVKELGLKRVILVGHSMGGPVSLAAAKRLPNTVVAVVGVDTLHNVEYKWPEEQSKKIVEALSKDFKGTMAMALRGMLPKDVDPKLLEWITVGAAGQDPKIALAFMRDMSGLEVKALMRDAKVPIRCINAAAEGFEFATPTAPDVNRKYGDFKAVQIEGVGHFPMLERPAEFNAKLREVLKEFAKP